MLAQFNQSGDIAPTHSECARMLARAYVVLIDAMRAAQTPGSAPLGAREGERAPEPAEAGNGGA